MNNLELLQNEAFTENIDTISYPFSSKRIKGLYCNGTIAINKNIDTNSEKTCILAEELGHYYTTVGNIIEQRTTSDQKQKFRAWAWSYNRLIGLSGIINAYKKKCQSLSDIAEFLNVTEEFLLESLKYYKGKYGICTTVDNYVI